MRTTALFFVLACQPVVTTTSAGAPPTPVESSTTHGDACQTDIPDCEAACALREVHRTEHLDWFDRRCAAVVLGKNPDKAVAYDADAGRAVDCDPPYTLDGAGRKKWKRECFD